MQEDWRTHVLGIAPDGLPITAGELADYAHCVPWVAVLAAPRFYARLRRVPPKEHLLTLLDAFLPYAHSKRFLSEVPRGQPRQETPDRGPCAERLRALIAQWEPPALTPEIRDAARALAVADACPPPTGGWDDYDGSDTPGPAEDGLMWPEGRWDEEAFLASQNDALPGPARG
jgi:hypothetical protein